MLGFESGEEGDAAAEEGGAEEAPAEEEAPARRRRNLQEEEPAEGEEAAAEEGAEEGAAEEEEEEVPLTNLAAAPYALVMRNQQGYRVSGKNISQELCYQAKQYKDLAEKLAKASK